MRHWYELERDVRNVPFREAVTAAAYSVDFATTDSSYIPKSQRVWMLRAETGRD